MRAAHEKLWATAMALAIGCSERAPEPTGCERTGCSAGTECQSGACVVPGVGDYPIALRADSPGSFDPAQWFGPLPLSDPGIDTVSSPRLGRLATLRGVVCRPDDGDDDCDNNDERIGARVELRSPSPLTGRTPLVYGFTAQVGEFEILAPPGRYDVVATPIDPSARWFPIRSVVDLDEPEDPDVAQRFDLTASPPLLVRGTILRDDLSPLANVRVRALDVASGRLISSLALTGAPDGAPPGTVGGQFVIAVPAETRELVLRASGSELYTALPTRDFGPLSLSSFTYHADEDVYEIPMSFTMFPELGPLITLAGTVEGRPRGGGRVAVGGASLRFSSDDLGEPELEEVIGSVERTVTSEADGSFSVALYKGLYEIEIVPPTESAYADLAVARRQQFVDARPENPLQLGVVLEVPARHTFAATVVEPDDEPAVGALVEVFGGSSLSDLERASLESRNHSATAVTTAAGAFLVQLDEGHYDVSIHPPADGRWPWAISPNLEIREDLTAAEPFVLELGRWLTGTVIQADRSPATGTTVEIWGIRADGSSVLCARASTDDEGGYAVLIPATL